MESSEITGPARLLADLPPGFKFEIHEDETLDIRGQNVWMVILRWPGASFEDSRDGLKQQTAIGKTQAGDAFLAEQTVQLDRVSGYRYLIKNKATGRTLHASYMLKVPGGSVTVKVTGTGDLDANSDDFDEKTVEPVLATLRIVPIS